MNITTLYKYDAFSDKPNKGNPAGIVNNADELTEEQMQEMALHIGLNETVFIRKSDKADLQLRYFTPGHEINLCGHGTIASLYFLKSRCLLDGKDIATIETKAGILPVSIFKKDSKIVIRMQQAKPVFKSFEGSIKKLASSIGLREEDIDFSIPIIYGSTGTWTLLVPIKSLEAFSRMIPDNKLFPAILSEMPHCSIHPFCFETIKSYSHIHARHFSSPLSGTTEDPVTGTASGVIGAYFLTYIEPDAKEIELIVEQGQEIDRDGEVVVHVKRLKDEIMVAISGTAVYISEEYMEYS